MDFEKKVASLLPSENLFVKQALKVSSETTSQEGAKKYSTSGLAFVDNFAAAATFKEPRSFEAVAKDMQILWDTDAKLCVKLAVYLRLITRKPQLDSGEKLDTQKGQGLKHEGIMRMLWLALNQPKTFKVNFPIFIAAGSWKDVIQMLNLDLQHHGWKDKRLDWNFFYLAISAGLTNSNTSELVRKYLPTIRTNKKCTTLEAQADTLIGRWLARKLNPTLKKEQAFKVYRKLKAEGTAHVWQQLISKQLYQAINFDSIAGRALSLLVGSRFLENHGLTNKYQAWINSKQTVKYTGYVYELFADVESHIVPDYQISTINAQFRKLVQEQPLKSKLLVVRDTSDSMTTKAIGCNVTSHCIAKSMALYFSEFLAGPFANTYAEFAGTCRLNHWQGKTPFEKYVNDTAESYGKTNFQSVIDLFIRLKGEGVPESDFPEGILCLSDGEFSMGKYNESTNFQQAIQRLKTAGFSKEYVNNFKIILWDIPNTFYGNSVQVKFEDFADAPNFFYMSGYDASCISFIVEGKTPPRNAAELFDKAMQQELLNKIVIHK